MSGKRYKTEDIIRKLQEAYAFLGQGLTVAG